MDNSTFEKTYVYPNRYMYWATRHSLSRQSPNTNNLQHLNRKLILDLHMNKQDDIITDKHLEELLQGEEDTELTNILTQCINSLTHCPNCSGNNWDVTYDGYDRKVPIIKVCKEQKCNFSYGFDDTFSCKEVLDKLNELQIPPNVKSSAIQADLVSDIRQTCQLQCPQCKHNNLDTFLVAELENDIYEISCEGCGIVLYLKPEQSRKPNRRDETLITSANSKELKKGDHIFWTKALLYEHHAIVAQVFEDNHVHVYQYSKGKKKCVNMEVRPLFNAEKEPVYRVNYENPFDARITLQHAEAKLCEVKKSEQTGVLDQSGANNYNLFLRNCEQFASYCKTGDYECLQLHRIGKVFSVIGSKMGVKALKEFAHYHGFKLIGRLALKSGTQAITPVTKLGRFLKAIVSTKIPGLLSTVIAFGVLVFIELIFCVIDICQKRQGGCKGAAFRSYCAWRVLESCNRVGASGVALLLSLAFTYLITKLAISFIIVFFIQAIGAVVIGGILLAISTWFVRGLKRMYDQKLTRKAAKS